MAYRQITRPQGDLNNLPPAQYDGNYETIQGVVRLIDSQLHDLWTSAVTGVPGPQGPAGDPGPTGATGATGPAGANGLSALGIRVTDSSPGVGPVTGYSPPTFDSTCDRLDIAANNSGTTINDLPAGADGQRVRIRNTGAVGTITLVMENVGSTGNTRFTGEGDAGIAPGGRVDIVYYGGSVQRWVL